MDAIDVPLPLDKLSIPSIQKITDSDSGYRTNCESKKFVVLLAPGSFNPPTYMHLRIFELAKDALCARGYYVVGGYMSPVNDAYKKKGLLSSKDRLQMCELACKSSSFITVDPWEAMQSSYQGTLNVLSRVYNSLLKSGLFSRGIIEYSGLVCLEKLFTKRLKNESLKVMLLCGSDMLESFSIPGFWIRDQVKSICKDFGIVCIRREGKDIDKILSMDEILYENKDNIVSVDVMVPNQISSTRIRECIKRGLSVKYLLPDEVIDYIRHHQLYLLSEG